MRSQSSHLRMKIINRCPDKSSICSVVLIFMPTLIDFYPLGTMMNGLFTAYQWQILRDAKSFDFSLLKVMFGSKVHSGVILFLFSINFVTLF